MSNKIFLNYRREDASAEARSIYQQLRKTFGKNQLFIDVDTIERGRDFRDALDNNLEQCKVLLAVIGPSWLNVSDENGERRLDNENDFVRLEIASALSRDITVIPVLVNSATMPKAEYLPDELKPLIYRQSASVRHECFPQDMDSLERDIRSIVGTKQIVRNAILLCLAVLTVTGIATYNFWRPLAQKISQAFQEKTSVGLNIVEVMEKCVTYPHHPDKSAVVDRLSNAFKQGKYQYGWIPEGNVNSSPGQNWKDITTVTTKKGELQIEYDWRGGKLRLIPVIVERQFITRSAIYSATLQGSWSQSNGYGCVILRLDDQGSAKGKWGVAESNNLDSVVYIRRLRDR